MSIKNWRGIYSPNVMMDFTSFVLASLSSFTNNRSDSIRSIDFPTRRLGYFLFGLCKSRFSFSPCQFLIIVFLSDRLSCFVLRMN